MTTSLSFCFSLCFGITTNWYHCVLKSARAVDPIFGGHLQSLPHAVECIGARSLFHQLYGQQPRASLYHLLLLLAQEDWMLSTEQSGHNLTIPDHWAEVPRAAIQLSTTHFPNRKGQNGHIPPPATLPNAHWPWCHELTVQDQQHLSLGASENENTCRLKHWIKAGQQTNQTAQAWASMGTMGGKGLHSGGHNKKSEVHCLPGSPTQTYWFNNWRFAYWNYSKCTGPC